MDNNRGLHCNECEYARMYDYGDKIYYCDHEGRIDDMGKLGGDPLPNTSPIWCPLRENE